MGLEVSVIEAAQRLLARVASPPVASSLLKLHQKHGVSIHTDVSVTEFVSKQQQFSAVKLANGSIIKGDMLVVGIGVSPDSSLAQKAGLDTEAPDGGAIIVDQSMQTSNSSIMAIGDVALRQGDKMRIESVHNAQDHAARAVAGLMGKEPRPMKHPGSGRINMTPTCNLWALSRLMPTTCSMSLELDSGKAVCLIGVFKGKRFYR